MSSKSSNENYPQKYNCILCDYSTSRQDNYDKHILTRKHKVRIISNNFEPKSSLQCLYCKRLYSSKSGLWYHHNKCTKKVVNQDNNLNNDNIVNKLIQQNFSLITQNQDFKELILEQNKQLFQQNKQLIELTKERTITNYDNSIITNNNNFNLNLFLNEQCKNALNIVEFVEQLPVSLEDLEETGRLGYVEGISRIFVNGLKKLQVHERPIHCSDMKREVLYIKDENKWEKDDINKTRLTHAIRKVGQKNMRQITEWQKLHPSYNDYYAKDSDKYLNIINNSMCGGSEEETIQNYSKIAKTIIKNVEIPKK
jgi:hypothetical protein